MTKAAELAKMGEVLTNSQIGGRRNIIINGAMQVAQRATSATGLGTTATSYHTLDRFYLSVGNTDGRLTMTQTADGPSGFANCLKLDCTTADTSIAANENMELGTVLEGQDLQQLKKGTSDAEEFTVSFYVKGNASATYSIEIYDGDNARHIVKEFSVTTSWTRVVLLIPADTTGTLDDDNAASLYFQIWLHSGSTYNGGTFAANWASASSANRASSNNTSFFDSTDRTFLITGFQVEVGSQATPFEHRSFGEELALCQRYYFVHNPDGLQTYLYAGAYTAHTTTALHGVNFPTTMRSAPTVGSFTTSQLSGMTTNTEVGFCRFVCSATSNGSVAKITSAVSFDSEL